MFRMSVQDCNCLCITMGTKQLKKENCNNTIKDKVTFATLSFFCYHERRNNNTKIAD